MTQKLSAPQHLQQHLQRINRLTMSIALGIVIVIVIITSFFINLNSIIESNQVTVEMFSENASATLVFNDDTAATELLESLRHAPEVDTAVIYDNDGKFFAHYVKSDYPLHSDDEYTARNLSATHYKINIDHIDFTMPILYQGRSSGYIHFVVSLQSLYGQMLWQIIITLIAATLAVFIGRLLLQRLSTSVLHPLSDLTGVIDSVSNNAEYDNRVQSSDIFELNILSSGFNKMLEQIQLRDTKLAVYNEELEHKVRDRTAQLKSAKDETEHFNQALQKKQDDLSAVLNATADGILAVNAEGKVNFANQQFFHLWQIPDELKEKVGDQQLLEHVLSQLTDPDVFIKKVKELYGSMEESLDTLEFRDKRLVERYSSPLIREGKNDGRVWSFRDITERINAEQSLITARDEAEAANLAKSQFLSSMSHELRTPLNAILGFAQLFEYDKGLTEDKKTNAREIYKAGEHLLTLIGEVLDLSKIEAGNIALSLEDTSLLNVLKECQLLIQPFADSHGISLELTLVRCERIVVNADYTRLKQVFLNLLSNAVKYNSRRGHISISCTMDDAGSVRVNVKDTGPGITDKQLKKLFQPFSRLGAEFGETEGTGIGLVITRQLVELMGGEVGVDSVPGKGSTFWVKLKITAMSSDEATVAPVNNNQTPVPDGRQVSSSQARMLLAEDNVANQEVFRQQLGILGYTADIVENGIKAFDRWQQGGYDILLTDLHMPLMDGYELVNKIRDAEQQTGEHIPVIAITANAMDEDAKRCLEAGMDAFIIKPVSLDKFQSTLEKWLPEKEPLVVASDSTVTDGADIDDSTVIDISMLEMLVGNDTGKHRLLFKSFVDSTPDIIQTIQEAYKKRISDAIVQQAHKLKSSARSMGANELADTCQMLEIEGKSSRWNQIDRLVSRLDNLYKEVNAYIEKYDAQTQSSEVVDNACFSQFTVLLVDDDQVMLDLEMMMLNTLGINNVMVALTGTKALAIMDEIDDIIHAVVCDLNMPEMDGIELLRHLAARNYTGGVMLISGEDARILHTAEKLANEHRLNVIGVLEKPITPKEIEASLKKLGALTAKVQPEQTPRNQIAVSVDELRNGIVNDELVVFFQPKIDVVSREVAGLEALVRWQHPDKGMIAPYLFVSMAEDNRLIDELTKSVFKQAIRCAAELKTAGFELKVAVNISVETLNDLDWPDFALQQVSGAGIDSSNIILEITESRLMENLASALEILTRLSMNKFKLSVDDFGTGYSSMEQLQRAPFSELKIDRAFVNGATHDKSARAILESSVDLAKKLNMSIVAEGVETQEDWDLIAELGCDQVQGYFIAKPMPFDELKTWLRQWNK